MIFTTDSWLRKTEMQKVTQEELKLGTVMIEAAASTTGTSIQYPHSRYCDITFKTDDKLYFTHYRLQTLASEHCVTGSPEPCFYYMYDYISKWCLTVLHLSEDITSEMVTVPFHSPRTPRCLREQQHHRRCSNRYQ